VAISFALAVGQFVWGAVQPLFGAVADKQGPTGRAGGRHAAAGAGLALTPFADSQWALLMTLACSAPPARERGVFRS